MLLKIRCNACAVKRGGFLPRFLKSRTRRFLSDVVQEADMARWCKMFNHVGDVAGRHWARLACDRGAKFRFRLSVVSVCGLSTSITLLWITNDLIAFRFISETYQPAGISYELILHAGPLYHIIIAIDGAFVVDYVDGSGGIVLLPW